MLAFAVVIAGIGWYMAHRPERASRVFTFGMRPPFGEKFAIAWCKILGWTFTIVFSFAIVFYLILIPLDILHTR